MNTISPINGTTESRSLLATTDNSSTSFIHIGE
jgi:hypothetical protein